MVDRISEQITLETRKLAQLSAQAEAARESYKQQIQALEEEYGRASRLSDSLQEVSSESVESESVSDLSEAVRKCKAYVRTEFGETGTNHKHYLPAKR